MAVVGVFLMVQWFALDEKFINGVGSVSLARSENFRLCIGIT